MQMQFEQQTVHCLRQALRKTGQQEATQEIRLEDEMPDIGDVLGCWGQVLVRSKQWRGTDMQIAGGVMVWVLYRPEDESMPQWVSGWLPFQTDFDFTQGEKDGVIRVLPGLLGVDARSISARKLLVRAQIQLSVEALVDDEKIVYTKPEDAKNVQLLTRTYPMLLPAEAGEKSFTLEEELTLPASCPPVERILSFRIQPEIMDQKVLADKVVFRGSCIVHMVYLGQDGLLRCWDFEVPFSQYAELDGDYEQDAEVDFWMAVTSMELEQGPEGQLYLKAGLTGQYILFQRQMLTFVEDAYVPGKTVQLQMHALDMPAILDASSVQVPMQLVADADVNQLTDVSIFPSQPMLHREGNSLCAQLSAKAQILYYDRNGQLQVCHTHCQAEHTIVCDELCDVQLNAVVTGKPQLLSGTQQINTDLRLDSKIWSKQQLRAVSQMQAEERQGALQPSLIIRAARGEDLWDLAKMCDSTVEAIEQANGLIQPPEMGMLLLIPVVV